MSDPTPPTAVLVGKKPPPCVLRIAKAQCSGGHNITITKKLTIPLNCQSRCSHDLLVDTISEMEHCITKIGTEVDFCQVAFFVGFQKKNSDSKHFSGSPRYSLLLQEWPQCLLQPCRGSQRPNSITNVQFAHVSNATNLI